MMSPWAWWVLLIVVMTTLICVFAAEVHELWESAKRRKVKR